MSNEEQWVCNGINDSKFILIECKRALKNCIIVSRSVKNYLYLQSNIFIQSIEYISWEWR